MTQAEWLAQSRSGDRRSGVDEFSTVLHLGGMLLVKASAKPSALHGLGVFAVEFVPKGTPIWRFEPGFDRAFTPDHFAALPPLAQAHLRP